MGLSIPQMALMNRLLDEALPLETAGRRAWLERLSPEYQDLAEVLREALLHESAASEGAQQLSGLPRIGLAAEPSALAAVELQAGVRVGPYELIHPLGAGGMAQVWLARRADGAFTREVALKLPTLTHLRADLEQRFARERDILASLEHPHIARFYDAGLDPKGLPYFALEYVHGEALTAFCDAHRLGIAARLKLLLQVLDAVQYAHARHVIHRDLKPSNILVNESGDVQLLDFGIAKLLEAEEADRIRLTSVYLRALTPDYASPELLRGDPSDVRSDVYSLGVVLYELLTGVRPYRLASGASVGLLEQAITHVELRKPSTQIEPGAVAARATTSQQLARALRGDLDAITLMALAKDPTERYPSAAALAEDLHRYLDGRTVQALPSRFLDRLSKFVRRNKPLFGVSVTAVAAIVLAVGYTLYRESSTRVRGASEVTVSAKPEGAATTLTVALPATAFSPPAHSVAVLPFVNLSGDKEQEYFSDGLTEELLNSLAQINDLQVAARTSSFSFKGEKVDLGTIARKLNVGAILEGSVRRSGDTIRITAQLNNSVTGFHIWSQTYDRKLSDVLGLQTEIATAVASALQVTLLGDVAERVELGGTRNPAAFDAYLRGEKAYSSVHEPAKDLPAAIAAYTDAIRLDPHYALAFAARSLAFSVLTWETTLGPAREALAKAQADARQALALAPDLARAYLAFAVAAETNLDLMQASEAFKRALALAPGNAEILRNSGVIAAQMGQFDAGLAAVRRAVALDPLNRESHYYLGWALYAAHRYEEAVSAYGEVIILEPDFEENYGFRGLAYYGRGDLQSARVSCETKPDFWASHWCLAVTYDKLGRHSDAETELSKLKAAVGDASAFQYATIYAQWGDRVKALEWLETALRLRDAALVTLKTFPLLDPLRKEPRFQAIERELKFPSARSSS